MIQFLSANWLFLGLLALPIIALYMLKLRRRDVQVSSTMLWSALLRDRQANTPWQRLKRNLLLLLQLLILAALVIALARPSIPVPTLASGSMIVLLDASASMSSTDISPTRFEAARQTVRELIRKMDRSSQMTLVQVSNPPVILANNETDQEKLNQALDKAVPSQGSADWSTAIAMAAGVISGQTHSGQTSVLVVSDGGLPAEGLPPLPVEARYIPIGKSGENLAIAALSLRLEQGRLQLFTSVVNYGENNHTTLLSIEIDGELILTQVLSFEPGETKDVTLSDLPTASRIVKAYLSSPEGAENSVDSLSLDNTAFAVNQESSQKNIFLLTQDYVTRGEENQFLLGVLSALELSARRPVLNKPASPDAVPAIPPLPADPYDLYILDGLYPVDPQTSQPVLPRNGSLLLINPPEITLSGFLTSTATVTPTLPAEVLPDPLTRYLDWSAVYIARTKTVEAASWARTLVRAGDLPLVLAGEHNGQRIAVISFDLHDSDLPLQVAYPILMANLFNYLLPEQSVQVPEEGIQPDESVEIRVPVDTKEIVVGKPGQSFVRMPVMRASLEFSETNELGIYAVNFLSANAGNDRSEYFAVNLFDPLESQTRPSPVIHLGQETVLAAKPDRASQRELWPWLGALALLILLIEWWAYHRRMTLPVSLRNFWQQLFKRAKRA
jgi:hypothetical protein